MGNANDVERFRRTPAQSEVLIEAPIASAVVVAKGDMVVLFAGKVRPMSDLGSIYNTELAARNEAARLFLGVAWDPSAAGETNDIRIDISDHSMYAYPCCNAAGTSLTTCVASVGDLYGVCAYSTAASAFALKNQSIEADCSYPIWQVARDKTAASEDTLLVKQVQNRMMNRQPSWAADTCRIEGDASFTG